MVVLSVAGVLVTHEARAAAAAPRDGWTVLPLDVEAAGAAVVPLT